MTSNMLIIYNTISFTIVILMLYLLYSQDYTILFGELLCSIIQYFSKTITTGWYPPIFKRPDGARDCNLFNQGGKSGHCSGFPSGHVASITVLMEMLLLRNNTTGMYNKITYYVPIMLMAYSRYMKKCHNIIQLVAGYVLGYSVANILHKYDDDIKRYVKTKLSYFFNSEDNDDIDDNKEM
jgi:membrane-associated phospholipid phosphatase